MEFQGLDVVIGLTGFASEGAIGPLRGLRDGCSYYGILVIPNDIQEDRMTNEPGPLGADEGPDSTYKLSLKGEGITVERDVPGHVARDIIAVVMGGGVTAVRSTTRPPTQNGPRGATGMSIREFIDEAGAKKNPQIVATIGQYIIDNEGQDRFTRSDVKARFAQAGEPTPANIARDVAAAVTSGWIAEDPRNEFYVTGSGRRAIEARFEGQKIRRPRRRSGKKASPKKAES